MLQIGMVHLEQRDGADVAEAMRAQRTNLHTVGQNPHHVADGFAEHDLATVCRRSDPGCVVDRHAHESLSSSGTSPTCIPIRTRRRRPSGHSCVRGPLRLDRGGEAGAGRVEA